jgi:hypothetical protein
MATIQDQAICLRTSLTASEDRIYRTVYGSCVVCRTGNAAREPFETSLGEPAKRIGNIIDVEIYMLPEVTIGGNKFYLLAIGEFSGYMS